MKVDSHQISKCLGWTAIFGNLTLPITDVIAILLHPGYNPLSKSVSDLALEPYGWVQGIGLFLGGIGVIACALGLSLVLSKQWEVKLGDVSILLVGISLILTAIFHTDPPGHEVTVYGHIHHVASFVAALSALPAFFLISPGIRNNRRLFIYTIISGILQIALEVGRGRLPSDWVLFGLHERLIGANEVIWIIVISWTILIKHRNTKSTTPVIDR